jgi:hypothetical protein
VSDKGKDKPTLESTDWMLPALKELAEHSKSDPLAREKLNKEAADWILLLIAEIEHWRSAIQSLEKTVASYQEAVKIWEETGQRINDQLIKIREEIEAGNNPIELFDKCLGELIDKDNDDDLIN